MKIQQRFISYIASPAVQAFLWGKIVIFLFLSPCWRCLRIADTLELTLQRSNHICNGKFPLFCSGHFICLSKILGRGVHVTFVIALSVEVEIYFLGSYKNQTGWASLFGDNGRSGIDTIKYHTWSRIQHGKVTKHIWVVTCDFQQCGVLTSEDSDEPVQIPFKLRNSKW